MDVNGEVLRAEERIRKFVRETPLEFSAHLSEINQSRTFLKFENAQVTGSFKARGALNKVLSLSEEEKTKGIVTASTGNHGLGVANALAQTGTKGVIYLPENASPAKVEAIRAFQVPVEFYGKDSHETEIFARRVADETGKIYISPYNDPQVIGGQGTIGIELMRQMPDLEYIFVSVGGGGLISGIAVYVKELNPKIRVIGCLPENAPAMYEAVKAGKIVSVEERPTLSDGTAGGLDEDSITFALCQKYVDQFILVSEREISTGMRLVYEHHGQIIEGSAGVSVAAFLNEKEKFDGKNCALVMCGGNIAEEKFKRVVGGNYD
jgi:threonine dehydratase